MARRYFLIGWLGSLLLGNSLLVSTSFGMIFNMINLYEETSSPPFISIVSARTINASETLNFNVSVWLQSLDPINVSAFQIHMSVNDTIVSITDAWLPSWNSSWIFHQEPYIPLDPIREDEDANSAFEAVSLGSALLEGYSVDVSHPVLLGIIELHVQGAGITILNISTRNEYTGLYETFLLDSNLEEIFVDLVDSQVEIYFQRIELIGDLNHDGKVNMQDVAVVSHAYGSYPGHPRWNPIADLNQDDKVNLRDIALVARHFGETDP